MASLRELQPAITLSSLHSAVGINGRFSSSKTRLRMRSEFALKKPTGLICWADSLMKSYECQWDSCKFPFWCFPLGVGKKSLPKSLSLRDSQHFPPLYWTRGRIVKECKIERSISCAWKNCSVFERFKHGTLRSFIRTFNLNSIQTLPLTARTFNKLPNGLRILLQNFVSGAEPQECIPIT